MTPLLKNYSLLLLHMLMKSCILICFKMRTMESASVRLFALGSMHSRSTQNLDSRRFHFERSGFFWLAFSLCVLKWYFVLTWVLISEIERNHCRLATGCRINRKSLSATKEKRSWSRDRVCRLNCLLQLRTSLNLRKTWKVFEKKLPQEVRVSFVLISCWCHLDNSDLYV